jgi:DNA-binding transcriptional LysR family regulator
VAALPSICSTLLPAVVAQVRSRHPGIVVRLHDAVAQRVLALVRAEEVDFGVGGFERVDAGMAVAPLFSDRLVAVLPSRHRLARKRRLTLADLTTAPLILMDSQSSVRALVEEAFLRSGKVLAPAYEVTYMTTAVGLVKAGQGITLIPSSAFELRTLSGMQVREVAHRGFERRIGVLRKAGRTVSPAAEGFIDVLKGYAASMK